MSVSTNSVEATWFKFVFTSPNSDTMIEAWNNVGLSMEYSMIMYRDSLYCGYGGVVPSDFTQTEMDNIIAEIESLTGLPVSGPYDNSHFE